MCGISGVLSININIVDLLYKSLFNLQHRGQESSGFLFYSSKTKKFLKSKKLGLVDEHINDLTNMEINKIIKELIHLKFLVGHKKF